MQFEIQIQLQLQMKIEIFTFQYFLLFSQQHLDARSNLTAKCQNKIKVAFRLSTQHCTHVQQVWCSVHLHILPCVFTSEAWFTNKRSAQFSTLLVVTQYMYLVGRPPLHSSNRPFTKNETPKKTKRRMWIQVSASLRELFKITSKILSDLIWRIYSEISDRIY